MTSEKIYFTNRENREKDESANADYIAELENKLMEKEIEARRARKRAEAYQRQVMKQRAEKRAEKRRASRNLNCAATLVSFIAAYWWVLAAAAGDLPALSAGIPLTIGLAAAYRWGKY